ncbi:MAG: hypothetical protein QMB65_13505 [Vicingaceae bacterium]
MHLYLVSKNIVKKDSIFPHRLTKNSSIDESPRLACCYDDLGISIALWLAGVALNDEDIKKESIDICLHTTKRKTKEEIGIIDAGIFHDTASLAHMYNRMYGYTKRLIN